MKIRTLIAIPALMLAATSAHAGNTLLTAPLYDDVGLIACRAVNVGATKVRLLIEARDADGGVIDAFGPVDVQPHENTGESPLVAGTSTCAFVLVEGKPSQIRAAANYRDPNSNLVIVPAR